MDCSEYGVESTEDAIRTRCDTITRTTGGRGRTRAHSFSSERAGLCCRTFSVFAYRAGKRRAREWSPETHVETHAKCELMHLWSDHPRRMKSFSYFTFVGFSRLLSSLAPSLNLDLSQFWAYFGELIPLDFSQIWSNQNHQRWRCSGEHIPYKYKETQVIKGHFSTVETWASQRLKDGLHETN